MNTPSTAREALIVEALGEVALLLDRVESLRSSMEAGRLALASANAEFADRLKDFEVAIAAVTQHAKVKAAEHIARRTGEATRISIEAQTRAMSEAARLAFSAQLDATLSRLNAAMQPSIEPIDRLWDRWLIHAATAAVSAMRLARLRPLPGMARMPWFSPGEVVSTFGFGCTDDADLVVAEAVDAVLVEERIARCRSGTGGLRASHSRTPGRRCAPCP